MRQKTPEMIFFGFCLFFAIFYCKSPCWLPKFNPEYLNALLEYESCVKKIIIAIHIIKIDREKIF